MEINGFSPQIRITPRAKKDDTDRSEYRPMGHFSVRDPECENEEERQRWHGAPPTKLKDEEKSWRGTGDTGMF